MVKSLKGRNSSKLHRDLPHNCCGGYSTLIVLSQHFYPKSSISYLRSRIIHLYRKPTALTLGGLTAPAGGFSPLVLSSGLIRKPNLICTCNAAEAHSCGM